MLLCVSACLGSFILLAHSLPICSRTLKRYTPQGPPKYGSADKQRIMKDLHDRMLAIEAQVS